MRQGNQMTTDDYMRAHLLKYAYVTPVKVTKMPKEKLELLLRMKYGARLEPVNHGKHSKEDYRS